MNTNDQTELLAEVAALAAAEVANDASALKELSEVELAYVGGGQANVIFG